MDILVHGYRFMTFVSANRAFDDTTHQKLTLITKSSILLHTPLYHYSTGYGSYMLFLVLSANDDDDDDATMP
jgi:hypothetical protein